MCVRVRLGYKSYVCVSGAVGPKIKNKNDESIPQSVKGIQSWDMFAYTRRVQRCIIPGKQTAQPIWS